MSDGEQYKEAGEAGKPVASSVRAIDNDTKLPADSQSEGDALERKKARKKLIGQAVRYLIVGFSSAAIELVIFFVLFNLLGINIVIGNIVAITCATTYNFFMSHKWTFKSVSSLPRSIVLYLILFVWNQLFSSWALLGLISLGMHSLLAKTITIGCIAAWNFFLYRKVVFI